jgi:hypothetical protein
MNVMRMLFVLMASSLIAMPSRAQDSKQSASYTPELGERLAEGKPQCELPPVPKGATVRADSLPMGAGTITLSVDFTAERQERPSSRRWNGDGGTTLTVLVAPSPMGGMAHSGGGNVGFESAPACAISVDGHRAVVDRVRVAMKADTMYLAIIPVFAKPGVIVNASIESPSARRRDELLARVAAMSLTH